MAKNKVESEAAEDVRIVRDTSLHYSKALYAALSNQLIVELQAERVFKTFCDDLQSDGLGEASRATYKNYTDKLLSINLLSDLIHAMGLTNYAEHILGNEIDRLFPTQRNSHAEVRNGSRSVPQPSVDDVEARRSV
jgi:hypothetical protein